MPDKLGLGKPTAGDKAWMVLAVGVALFDGWAAITNHDTMSQSYARALDNPKRRWPTLIFWGYLTGHLTRVIPDKADPLRGLGMRIVYRLLRKAVS